MGWGRCGFLVACHLFLCFVGAMAISYHISYVASFVCVVKGSMLVSRVPYGDLLP